MRADERTLYTLKEVAFKAGLPETTVARYLRLYHDPKATRYSADSVSFVLEVHQRGFTRFERLLDSALTALDRLGEIDSLLEQID